MVQHSGADDDVSDVLTSMNETEDLNQQVQALEQQIDRQRSRNSALETTLSAMKTRLGEARERDSVTRPQSWREDKLLELEKHVTAGRRAAWFDAATAERHFHSAVELGLELGVAIAEAKCDADAAACVPNI